MQNFCFDFLFLFPIRMANQFLSFRRLTRLIQLTLYMHIQHKCSYVNNENKRKQLRIYRVRISITSRKKNQKNTQIVQH